MEEHSDMQIDPEVRETVLTVIKEENARKENAITQGQKIILGLMAVIILLMLLFPPFYTHLSSTGSAVGNVGYGFILDPPKAERLTIYYNVNYMLLITQWIGVLLAGSLMFILLRYIKK